MDIKTSCLGVLSLGDASGYEIRKAFEDGPFSHFAEGGFGSIYPALTRLTDEGLVTCSAQQQEKRPAKKVYHITESGWEYLEQAMRKQMPADDKYKSDLLFILFFADWQDPSWIARVIETRIAFYQEKLDHLNSCDHKGSTETGRHLVHGFGCALYQAALDYLVANRDAFVAVAGQTRHTAAQAAE